VSKTFRPYAPTQSYLFPPSPLEWLPKDHLAFFVMELVGEMDLSPILSVYEREERGYPPYHPAMMLALLVYGYAVGARSSRQIEKRTHEDVAFRVIAGGAHPDHSRISDFRRRHLDAFAKLFVDILLLCQEAGLVKLGHVALDGTKVKANASKHKAMSFDRMKKEEARLKALVDEMLAEADSVDDEEDARYGKDKRGDEITDEKLRDPATRRARIRELRAKLEAEAKATAAKEKDDDSDGDEPPGNAPLPAHKVPTEKDGKTPTPKAQRNFTDGDSRIMKAGGDFVQAYNCQAAVDEEHQIIVAQVVTNQPPDVEHLVPMVEEIGRNLGELPSVMTADMGYFSSENVAFATTQGIDVYIPSEKWRHGERPPSVKGRPPTGMTLKEEMRRKLRTQRGAAIYRRRKAIVEPVFGQIKEARGIRRFLLRGLEKVRAEWSLIAATHNLLKLFRSGFAVAG
jgi:transposase